MIVLGPPPTLKAFLFRDELCPMRLFSVTHGDRNVDSHARNDVQEFCNGSMMEENTLEKERMHLIPQEPSQQFVDHRWSSGRRSDRDTHGTSPTLPGTRPIAMEDDTSKHGRYPS